MLTEIYANDESPSEERANALYIHKLFKKLSREKRKNARHGWRFTDSGLIQPIKKLRDSLRWTKNCANAISRHHGVSVFSQFAYQQQLAVKYGIPASSYYKYRFYLDHSDAACLGYIYHEQILVLLDYLNSKVAPADANALHDKRIFFRHCHEHDLATSPIIAEFTQGKLCVGGVEQQVTLPHKDLFSKPAAGVCGIGTSRWFRLTPGTYRSESNETYSEKNLIQHLTRLSTKGSPLILQERLINHRDIARLSGGGLCTLRVVTCRDPGGPVEHVASVLRMATGRSPADNFARGGIASPVDEKNGTLGEAVSKNPLNNLTAIRAHPDTGNHIEGFKVPFWNDSLALAMKCHASFHNIPFVGWDIAVTDDGPLVLEGNPVWDVELIQIPHHMPLLYSKFGACYRRYAEDL